MGIVDCDVHPYATEIGPVLPYMTASWRKRFERHVLREAGHAPNVFPNRVAEYPTDKIPPHRTRPGSDPKFMATDLLDKWNIEAAILISLEAASVCAWADPVEASILVSAINEYLVQQWLPVDDRYRLAIAVVSQNPPAAVEEIRRHADNDRVVAIYCLPAIALPMGNLIYHPIYAAAEECGLALYQHAAGNQGMFSYGPTMAGGMLRTHTQWTTLLGQQAQTQIVSLIGEGVFERFPRLKVVFAEYGFTWIPSLLWRFDMKWRDTRAEVPWMKRSPSEYFREHIRLTTQPMEEPERRDHMTAMIDMMDGSHTLLFSSDYPHRDTDNPTLVGRWFTDSARARVFRDNAIETFGPRLLSGATV